jgi:hypothetical protein
MSTAKMQNLKKGGFMSNTQTLLTSEQQTITAQEYQEYKRRLLDLRRQYAELMHGNRFEKTEVYAQKLRELEQTIAETEERLASTTLEAQRSSRLLLARLLLRRLAACNPPKKC